jgi:hypothetical protein
MDANCGREHLGSKSDRRFGYDGDGSRGRGSSRGHPIVAVGCGDASKKQEALSSHAKSFEKAQKTRSRQQTQPPQVMALVSVDPTADSIAAELTVPERVLVFCLAWDTDWQKAGVTHDTAQHMMVRGLIERDQAASHLILTEQGHAVLAALLDGQRRSPNASG